MTEHSSLARLSTNTHSGLITFRPFKGRELGAMLLNLSETEARIKFLPGFLSATFLMSEAGTCAEIVQWKTGRDLAQAFGTPEFSEHLPVTEIFAPHPGLAFANPSEILTSDGSAELELSAPDYAILLFKTSAKKLENLHILLCEWVGGLISETLAGAAIYVDTRQIHCGLLLLGSFSETPTPPAHLALYLLEQMGPLQLYASVTPPSAEAKPLIYKMALLPSKKFEKS